MTSAVFGAGAVILVLLGAGHSLFTLQSGPSAGPMMPTNPEVAAAMQIPGGLGLAPELQTTLFRAWIGFNLSHSLGLVAIGAVLLYHAAVDLGVAASSPWFVAFAAAGPAVYSVLAVKYWFDKPRDAITMATVLIWVGLLIEVLN